MSKEKPDAGEFRDYIKHIPQVAKLDLSREWWPRFLFHFTNIRNAVSILSSGELLSRSLLLNDERFDDSASPDIIQQTSDVWKDYVRLYFRPRTPTLFNNEGFRPKAKLSLNAHCPMPIYFFFDLEDVICREDSLFSWGSLARKDPKVFSTFEDFKNAPFDLIYHDSGFGESDRDTIINHRQAEVIVPKRLSLESLKYIRCRSQAELETLRYYLPGQTLQRWREKMAAKPRYGPFFNRWVYIEQATLTKDSVVFTFHLPNDQEDRGPFVAHLEITEKWTGEKYIWDDPSYEIANRVEFNLSNLKYPDDYEVRLTLDGYPAFTGRYQRDDIPF